MTADDRAALVDELALRPMPQLLAMVVVELIELRDVLAPPPEDDTPAPCEHPEERRVLGGMGTGILFSCLECGHVEKDRS